MVQAIENGTDVSCTILDRSPSASLAEYDQLSVTVDAATPVPGLKDLLSSRVGDTIELVVRRALLPEGALRNRQLRCRARLAGPGVYMAEQNPPTERFEVSPA